MFCDRRINHEDFTNYLPSLIFWFVPAPTLISSVVSRALFAPPFAESLHRDEMLLQDPSPAQAIPTPIPTPEMVAQEVTYLVIRCSLPTLLLITILLLTLASDAGVFGEPEMRGGYMSTAKKRIRRNERSWMRGSVVGGLAATVGALVGCTASSEDVVEGLAAQQGALHWGVPADKPDLRGIALLGSGCTATLIAPSVILTAAHCVSPYGSGCGG